MYLIVNIQLFAFIFTLTGGVESTSGNSACHIALSLITSKSSSPPSYLSCPSKADSFFSVPVLAAETF